MRWGIEAYRTGVRSSVPDAEERLGVLVGRYDRALMQMAILLGVAIGSAALTVTVEQLSDEFRSLLEKGVCGAGIELPPPTP